jgi:peroxiredoxin
MTDQSLRAPIEALAIPLPDTDGTTHELGTGLANGPLLLTIYKSSCAASKAMLPMLGRIDEKHRADGLTTIAISQDSPNITRSFAKRYGIDYPLLVEGSEYPISNAFDIRATPSVYLIRQDGTVAYGTMGFMRDQLEEIEQVVATELQVEPALIVGPDETEIPWFVPG